MCLSHKPSLVFIAEPMISQSALRDSFWAALNLKFFAENNRGDLYPSLWGLCSVDLFPVVLDSSDQHFSFSLCLDNNTFNVAVDYAHTTYIRRRDLWSQAASNLLSFPGPWCIIGDFNSITGAHESSSRFLPNPTACSDFVNFIQSSNLINLPTRGAQFTWTNKRREAARTDKRLDRSFCNEDWLLLWNNVFCCTLPRLSSDHHPLLFQSDSNRNSHVSAFKFQKMWLENLDCRRIVLEAWHTEFIGCPMMILSKKLKLLKKDLRIWNKSSFGNIHHAVSIALQSLESIQNEVNLDCDNEDLLAQENLAQKQLLNALNLEEIFWKDKARVNWHTHGDRNTSYFHKLTRIREATKAISMIRHEGNIITDPDEISSHIVHFYMNLFNSSNDIQHNHLINSVIPSLVTEVQNNLLITIPTNEEIKSSVFDLSGASAPGPDGFSGCFYHAFWDIIYLDVCNSVRQFFSIPTNEEIKSSAFGLSGASAPGPDGFSGCFYHAFWDIIHLDVCNSVRQFFQQGWILPNLNANSVILIPKFKGADKVEDFRPIALANFQFKIITKLIADRLASLTPIIISSQQRGFIKGRQIQDCIYLASEAINLLPHKVFGGNLAIKLDIKKAFDTIDWVFLLDTLKAFGFCQVFCSWINTILHSAKLSININGSQVGFFNCSRGVRQGDPLSPLLFCIAEDVLSRGITSLVSRNKLSSISGPRNLQTPSHVLYADDIIIFCKATAPQLLNLKNLVLDYSKISGQVINLPKCNFFSADASARKIGRIASTLGFSAGSIPFSYLGVPIFYGKPRKVHLQAIADRILSKLANWKGASLSIMGRVEIVKSIIQSMLVYSFHVYKWPATLLKLLDNAIRNFIWSGSSTQQKICTVAWSKMCSPTSEGGLGLRSLRQMNRAALLKLAWDMRTSTNEWACFYRERFGCHWTHSSRYYKSSIWPGIRDNWSLTSENAIWLVGDGHQVHFWLDNWIEEPIVDFMHIPLLLQDSLKATCASFIVGNHWLIPKLIKELHPSICSKIAATKRVDQDKLIWKASADGSLSMKMAFSTFSINQNSLFWCKLIWTDFIPPSRSFLVWRLIHARLPTDENLMIRGCAMASICSLCFKHTENSSHLFLNCTYASSL
ncbi:PREDICTED: uncharacterized protein LOC109338932 [Lupinus angustifolius]|uniref:uncharacterized protein LOC109338932 n=1 Tax=Lupinus angustifolius TaxID=3871 RepID=UPI00092E531C|nr:PREDICTED: uncharacterized protein LOC109338932 [Lupinus angustifolius]